MNSKPTKINQEPGVKGVAKADKPIIIKIMPIVFLVIIFIFILPPFFDKKIFLFPRQKL